MVQKFIKIHSNDLVAVALCPLEKGTVCNVDGQEVTLIEDIAQGHKFALKDIKKDQPIIKYGYPIGIAKEDIKQGSWIHTHNMKTGLNDLLTYSYHRNVQELEPSEKRTFMGYRRKNGKVGVRNEIWIIPTVGCMNNVATSIERQAQMGDDQENTRTILADLIQHPNAGGVLVLGLGCENSNIDVLKNYLKDYDTDRVKFLVAQEHEDEIQDSLDIIADLADIVSQDKREEIDASELIIGMKCGGSDGLSGISANPTVGGFSDLLISKGGTTILTEVPEMFGAETILMDRCENKELFNETVNLINNFKEYFKSHHQTIYENPSPGNKKGGISTLEDKSLGCTQKSGKAPVVGVLQYGQCVKNKGLNLLSAPGNDLVAATALAASGAHIVLFTTVKISSNSRLYSNKKNWIDFNCGELVEGVSLDTLSNDLFEYVLSVASGKKVKSEEAGFHDMAIFKQGVTL